MKVIAYTSRDEFARVICELSKAEFELVTGTPCVNCNGFQNYRSGSEVGIVGLIYRVRDALKVAAKLSQTAESLRGMATVLDHIDALVPELPKDGA